jgi:long-chain acyl-CoA synthetase
MTAQVYRRSFLLCTTLLAIWAFNTPLVMNPNASIFTNAGLLPVVAKVIAEVPYLRIVLYDGRPPESLISKITSSREGVAVFSPRIMDTSGGTGLPNGVVIKHSNLIATIGAVNILLGHHLKPDEMFLAFLLLAHILEYVFELFFVFVCIYSGYNRVKMFTDQPCETASAISRRSVLRSW